jgi:23S rRNA (cytosine1962-C5)-methyltransferase
MDNKTIGLLEAAIEKRRPLKRCTNALRLVNGLGDGLKGLVLEQYNLHFAAQIFDKRWIKEEEALAGFVKSRYNGRYLIIKDRTISVSASPDAFKSRVWIEDDVSSTMVEENGLKFAVDLNDTLNSGLFLDMRHNRKIVSGLVKDRKVLNCFAYTCSFGVYCRAAGAASVVNVDISRKSLAQGQHNYELNQLAFSHNEFICGDAVYYLKRALIKNNRFDLIILDPPSFARHEGKAFIVKKDFPQLINSAIKALNPDGFLFVSTNFSGISLDNLKDMVNAAAGERRIKNVLRLGQDKDFIGSGLMQESYLAALLVKV